MADESKLREIARALTQAMRPGLGSAYMPSQQPTLPTPPTPQPAYQAPFAGPHNEPLPPFQQQQGLAAYQPPVIPGPQGSYGPGGGAAPQLPPPPPGMAPLQAAPAAWQGLGLGDQNRVNAFDPVRDANDPRNVNMVGPNGQVNPLQGPVMPAPGGVGPYIPPGYQ